MNKAVSISVFTVIYILGVSFVQNAFRNDHDVGTGILYLYSTLLYVISFIISFSIFGGNKKRKYIFLATYLYSTTFIFGCNNRLCLMKEFSTFFGALAFMSVSLST